MVIKALIPLWKRPDITRICFEGIKRLQKFIEIDPICICSEPESAQLCNEFGFESYEYPNSPLGKKLNYGLEMALASKWDYLIQIGSDDLISEELFEIYKPFYGSMAFGVGCIYFYDVKTKTQARQKGMQVYGCGRMISREVLDNTIPKVKIRYLHTSSGVVTRRKGQEAIYPVRIAEKLVKNGIAAIVGESNETVRLWDDDKMSGLDLNSEFKLNAMGINVQFVDIGDNPLVLDIKSEVNIHDINEYEKIDFDVLNNFQEGEHIRRLL